MEISSRYIKLQGKAEIENDLENATAYHVVLDGEVRAVTDKPNDDGTFTRAFVFRPLTCEVQDEHGKTVSTKRDTRKHSQRLRGLIWKKWNDATDDDTDFDEAYERTINYYMVHGGFYQQAKEFYFER